MLVSNLQQPYNPPHPVQCTTAPNPPVALAGLGTGPIYNHPPAGGAPGAVVQFLVIAPQGNMGGCLTIFHFQCDQDFYNAILQINQAFQNLHASGECWFNNESNSTHKGRCKEGA